MTDKSDGNRTLTTDPLNNNNNNNNNNYNNKNRVQNLLCFLAMHDNTLFFLQLLVDIILKDSNICT